MGLPYEVLRWATRAIKDPNYASDPVVIDKLSRWAKDAFEGIVALHAPVSPMTWEVNTVLLNTTTESQRQPFRFPWPVEIIGMFPTVIDITTGEAFSASTNHIRVRIDTDAQNYTTSGEGVTTPAGGTVGPYVTLSAMSVQVPRLMGYKLRTPTPDIGFTYQWKVVPTTFRSCFISMAMYARRIHM